MVKQTDRIQEAQGALAIKVEERAVDANNPWVDDLLQREDIAKRLTNMVVDQRVPFTISLNGGWGTGKTFLLKRWQKDLEKQGFKAIYFNAWEDDFCDDPLLAILAQLADHFKEEKLKELARSAAKVAIPLIRENALGVLKATTGITLKVNHEKDKTAFLDAYLEQKTRKDKLKKKLADLSANVVMETGRPVVFIIDELDRCRPTFAIELLERVKHIFDVPNVVFVLGINRDELAKSLQSVYGEIDSDVYLRRFFDFDFQLSVVDAQGYAIHLIERFQLADAFQRLNQASGQEVHGHDSDNYVRVFPKLWSALGLSLRDIDYGIRLLAVLARNISPGTRTHPFLLGILIAMKFKNPNLYDDLVRRNFRASDVIDYIVGELKRTDFDPEVLRHLDRTEGFLYCADTASGAPKISSDIAINELLSVSRDETVTPFQVLSKRVRNPYQGQLERIMQAIEDGRQLGIDGKVFADLASLIDTYQPILKR